MIVQDYKNRQNNIHLHVSGKKDQNPYLITEIGYGIRNNHYVEMEKRIFNPFQSIFHLQLQLLFFQKNKFFKNCPIIA